MGRAAASSGGRRDSRPWIETPTEPPRLPESEVAAGVTAGRGLKRLAPCHRVRGQRGGRRDSRPWIETADGCASEPAQRCGGRPWIETLALDSLAWWCRCGGRRDSRPWIETLTSSRVFMLFDVAAGVTAGRGLKHNGGLVGEIVHRVAAGVTAGRGLKLRRPGIPVRRGGVAAGVTAGRGLKRITEGS